MYSPKNCPCRYCVPPKRHPACHDTCKDYIKWSAPLVQAREERQMRNTIKEILTERVDRFMQRNAISKKRNRK